MSTIRVHKVEERNQVVLPGLGLAKFDGRGGIRLQIGGEEVPFSLGAIGLERHSLIALWSDPSARTLVIVEHYGLLAASIRLDSRTVELTAINHDPDLEMGLWHSEFVETPRGPLLVYELGVIAFNLDGTVRWRAEHPSIQWVFLGVEGDRVVFDNEFEGQWRYRVQDGQKQVVPSK